MKYSFIPTTQHCTLIPFDYSPEVDYSFLNITYKPDTFQLQSFELLQNNEDILVTAHTSCGKTLVAEYCIHLQLKNNHKVIYTTPLKTLSNQKYYYFSKIFDTGIITGDISLNTNASLLIMTTEIFHSRIEEMDCSYVIFDEVHYINDRERGYVWEESLIKYKGNILCLSATIDNKKEFSDWLGRQRNKHCYVISTKERVIPLEYMIYYENKGYNLNGEINLKYFSEKEQFKHKIIKKNKKNEVETNYFKITKEKRTNVYSLVNWLKEKELIPSILFTFSRSKIDKLSDSLHIDLTTDNEKSLIKEFLNKVNLPPLPQVSKVKEMLLRGIAIHYSTMIPLLKESVEFLISFGLVKVLFATETFAVGVNMPAKSVVFLNLTKITKENGSNQFRYLNSSEFTQMSGRAGRRGLDSKGVVILTDVERKDTLSLFKSSSLIVSQFKVTFNFVLRNDPSFLRKTFLENESDKRNRRILQILSTENISVKNNKYFTKMKELIQIDYSHFIKENDIIYTKSNHKLKVLGVKDGILVDKGCKECLRSGIFFNMPVEYTCGCNCHKESEMIGNSFVSEVNNHSTVINDNSSEVNNKLIDNLFNECINIDEMLSSLSLERINDKNNEERMIDKKSVIFLEREGNIGLDLCLMLQKSENILNELKEMNYPDNKSLDIQRNNESINNYVNNYVNNHVNNYVNYNESLNNELINNESINKEIKLINYRNDLKKEERIYKINELKKLLTEEDLKLINDYNARKEFLNKNNYFDLKEKCAKKIRVLEDILLVEMLFSGLLKNLNSNELCSLISCLANRDIVECISQFVIDKSIVNKINEFILSLNERMIDIPKYSMLNDSIYSSVYVYLTQMSFYQISEFVNEGIFVKIVTRTDEGIRELSNLCEYIGDTQLLEIIKQIDLRKSETVRESLYVIA